ncbi:MAG TPA: alpha/beta hydrolase [Isosphaeraceae bacterium]|jgi:acetyl esterase/lipase
MMTAHAAAEEQRRAAVVLAQPDAMSYPHQSVHHQQVGSGARSYWLFEPADPSPSLAPVVVFCHGWLATNPGVYGAWIEHLARQGRIVIFPRYQDDWTTPPARFLPHAVDAVRDALDVLETAPGHVRPRREQMALIGHSAGGNLAAELAAVAGGLDFPPPRAVVAVLPGEVKPRRGPSLAGIPAATLLVVVAAADDWIVGDLRARQIYLGATAVAADRKEFVLFRTDRHGSPPLVADHVAPTAALPEFDSGEGPAREFQMAQAELNALDVLGFWRLADLTLGAAFAGRTLDETLGHGSLRGGLGRWSDGRAVVPPLVGDELSSFPRVFPANGIRLVPWQPRSPAAPDRAALRTPSDDIRR